MCSTHQAWQNHQQSTRASNTDLSSVALSRKRFDGDPGKMGKFKLSMTCWTITFQFEFVPVPPLSLPLDLAYVHNVMGVVFERYVD